MKRIAAVAWAAPCSLLGLLFAALVLAAGGSLRRPGRGVVEAALRDTLANCGARARRLPFRAITFGHVILGVTHEELQAMRAHELVHVVQYERWGPLFLLAYPLASAWQWLRGRRAYWDNPFEVQARKRSGC